MNDLSEINPTEAFTVPGSRNWIDLVHPNTGRSCINGETLEQIQLRYPNAIKVNIQEWLDKKAAQQDAPVEWREVTLKDYDEARNALPPAAYLRAGFMLGEPQDHHATSGKPRYDVYVQMSGKYFVSSRPMTIEEARKL